MRARPLVLALEPLVAGVLGAALLAVVATARVRGFPVGTSDFLDYCSAVDVFRTGRWEDWPGQRSVLAGALPGLLGRSLGILHGLVYASAASTVLLLAALWGWAWALAGRRAGWLAVAWAGAFAPVLALSRTVSFYPEVAVLQVASAAAVAAAIARGAWGWSVVTAAMLFLLPLSDVRSVLHVVLLGPAAVLAALALRAPLRARVALAASQIGALALAWRFGAWSYPSARYATLQASIYTYVEDAARLAGLAWRPPPWELSPPFAWARTPLENLLPALAYLRAVDASRPAGFAERVAQTADAREMLAWVAPTAGALALALIGLALARRPRAMLALAVTAPVFFGVLASALRTLPHLRQLATGALVLPVVFGVASALALYAADAARARLAARWPLAGARAWKPVTAVLAVGLLVAAVGGVLDTRLHPHARWRPPIVLDAEPAASIRIAREGGSPDPAARCANLLRDDARQGSTLEIPLYTQGSGPPSNRGPEGPPL